MGTELVAIWVQVAAVLVAVGAAVVALVISALDRRSARAIAAKDRAVGIRQAHLLFELDSLLRLEANLRRGGSNDIQKSRDMGAEAGALIGAIGPERLPLNWEKRIGKTDDELREFSNDDKNLDWLRRSVEAQRALSAVVSELRELRAGTLDDI
ncbi:hypothetical protein [Curtobacterium sp. SORGH_AS_0776]|jgi:hypothetical protein|uniref:hypothetical protein n=1 Tax=Curtobacterium sp. SORGH_AS_0776 TaxID=3041798 RepID=UPI002856F35B|nr:hypothetical protein [Curtobacterium sp. SORGH_AS_0776]MDR6171561.1 hypothetical protein [Curtobacterium sp. SORGH_AS_0776]